MTAASATGPAQFTVAPGLLRRLASLLYEGVLLFGVVMGAALLYALLTDQRHALAGSNGLKLTLFVVLGGYFVYFWSRHGQTLAMKTWRLRLLGPDGRPPTPRRAGVRYLLAWLWFLPALGAQSAWGLNGGGTTTVIVVAGVLGYAALARLRADRQFFHDVVCGTRLVDAPSASGPAP